MMDPQRVLIVEDDAALAESLRYVVADALPGAACDIVDTLSGALRAIGRATYRVVVLDLYLDDSRGLATLETMARAVGLEHIVVMSGMTELEEEVNGRGVPFVAKPFRRATMVSTIRAAAASRPPAAAIYGLLEAATASLQHALDGGVR